MLCLMFTVLFLFPYSFCDAMRPTSDVRVSSTGRQVEADLSSNVRVTPTPNNGTIIPVTSNGDLEILQKKKESLNNDSKPVSDVIISSMGKQVEVDLYQIIMSSLNNKTPPTINGTMSSVRNKSDLQYLQKKNNNLKKEAAVRRVYRNSLSRSDAFTPFGNRPIYSVTNGRIALVELVEKMKSSEKAEQDKLKLNEKRLEEAKSQDRLVKIIIITIKIIAFVASILGALLKTFSVEET